jgi:hypothetical protein
VTVTGTVAPVPALTIGGALVAAGPNPDGTWPALMALAGAQVKWGRDQVLNQPKAGTATVAVFDPSGVWAAGQDLIGQPVTLSWTWAGTSRVYFRGRIAAVDLDRHTARRPDGNLAHGARVTLSCTSLLTDLGNRTVPQWFAEPLSARRDHIAALCAGPVSTVATAASWDAAQLFATDPGKTTALAALGALFDACGATRYTWNPDTRAVTGVGRRSYPTPGSLTYLARSAARVGVFITSPDGWIDGDGVIYTGGAGKDMGSRLTRAQVTYSALNAAGTAREAATVTVQVPGADETVVGERAIAVTTAFMDSGWATSCATALAALAAGEASGWRLDPMRWETRRTGGGFETLAQATLLLAGYETPAAVFLSGTWLPDLGIRPVFGVMGGTITYTDAAWTVEWNPAPIGVTGPPPPAVTWDDLDPSLVWDDAPNPNAFHDSVTYEDLAFVSSGSITNGA